MAANTYPFAGGFMLGRTKIIPSGQPVVQPSPGVKPYPTKGILGVPATKIPAGASSPLPSAGNYGFGSAGENPPSPNPLGGPTVPGYNAGSMRLPGQYGIQPPGSPVVPQPKRDMTSFFTNRRMHIPDSFKAKPPPAPAPLSGQTAWSALHPQVNTPAPAPLSGQNVWSALHPNGNGPSGQNVWSALHPQGTTSAAPIPAAPAPAAPAPGRMTLGSRIGSRIGHLASAPGRLASGLAGGAMRMAGPAALTTLASMASDNPDEGFMHLDQPNGSFREGARRLMTSAGHMISGESAPGDVTAGEIGNAFMHHTAIGDLGTGIGNMIAHPINSTYKIGGQINGMAKEAGHGITSLGNRLFGNGDANASTPSQALPSDPSELRVPNQWSSVASHGNADQLNGMYGKLGIGGPNPVASTISNQASSAQAMPRNSDTPAVTQPGSTQPGSFQQPMSFGPQTAVYRGGQAPSYEGFGVRSQFDPADYSLNNAMQIAAGGGDYEGLAGLGHALANYRGQTGHGAASMISAQADMMRQRAEFQKNQNPLAPYMNPLGLSVLDQNLGGSGNIIGTGQANGIGLGPHGEINPAGMGAYTQIRHPEFSSLVGNKDWSLDQARELYNQSKSRFSAGDQQLGELQNYVRQLLASRFQPQDLDSETTPSLFGRIFGDSGAAQNNNFVHELGVR